MANIKITDLNNFADPNSTDVLPIVDVAEDETKKVSIGNLMKSAFAGTAALPGVAFAVDEDTGMYRNASDQLAFATGGVERILIDDNGDVTISGSLTVNGTTTTIDSTTLTVEDKNIELGVVDTPSDTTADGGGITLKGATDKTINWVDSTDSWTSSENVDLASGKTYKIAGSAVLSATELGAGVTNSSLTSVGTITTGVWNGTALTADAIGADAINGSKIADDSIDSEHYVDGSIDNVHVSASAAIAGTKISADFGAQNLTVDTNVLHVDATNDRVGVGTASVDTKLVVAGNNNGSTNNNTLRFVDLDTSSSATQESGRIEFLTSDSTQSGVHSYIAGQTLDTNGNGGLTFGTGLAGSATEKARIDSSGRLLVGTNTDIADTGTALLQAAWTGGGGLILARNDTGVTEGNDLGYIKFMGNDTTSNTYRNLGLIQVEADGTHAAGDNPTRMLFWTTADGAENPTERMRIDSSGNVVFNANRALNRPRIILSTPDEGTDLRHLFGANLQVDTSGTFTTPATSISGGGWLYQSAQGLDNHGDMIYLSAPDTNAESSTPLERLRIDSSGRLLVGSNSARTELAQSDIQLEGTGSGAARILVVSNNNLNANGSGFYLARSRGDAVGDFDIVQDNDALGSIFFQGADGTDLASRAAEILGEVDGTPAENSIPGALAFRTTAEGDGNTTERMRIDSSGRLLVGTNSAANAGASAILQVVHASGAGFVLAKNDTTITSDELIGQILFSGNDSNGTYQTCAAIQCRSDGAHGTNDKPSALVFRTTPDGGNSAGERMRIDSSGVIRSIGNITGTYENLLLTDNTTNSSTKRAGINCLHYNTAEEPFALIHAASSSTANSLRIGGNTSTSSANTATEIRFFTASNQTTTAAPEIARFDSSGRLLIGTNVSRTTGTDRQFQIEGTSNATSGMSVIRNSNDAFGPTINLGKTRGTAVGANTLVAENDNVGSIYFRGGDNTDCNNIAAGIEVEIDDAPGSNDMPGRLIFSTTPNGGTSPTEHMRIDSVGTVSMHRQNGTQQLRLGTIDGSTFSSGRENYMIIYGESATDYVLIRACNTADGTPILDCQINGTRRIEIESDGDIYNTNGTYSALSDARLKENIVDAASQWDDVKALRVRKFNFTEASGYPTDTKIGFVAQEVEQVSPGLVKTNPDEDIDGSDLGTTTKTVKTSILFTKAVKALQEAMERIETLEAKVAALEAG
jgi:hypothetical protein